MKTGGSLEYAHARIGARWGRRADEATWHRLENTRDLAGVLEIALGSGLAPWVEGLTAAASPQAIERLLHRRLRECAHEVADWMPSAWRDAITWCTVLAELALMLHLARGNAAPAGLDDDLALRRWRGDDRGDAGTAAATVDRDRAALLHGARSSPEQDAARSAPDQDAARRTTAREDPRGAPGPLLEAWLVHWRACAPAGAARAEIERQLGARWRRHLAALATPGADTASLRRALHAQLAALLRRAALEPLAAFVYLALLALDVERLRAELVGRAAFPRRTPRA